MTISDKVGYLLRLYFDECLPPGFRVLRLEKPLPMVVVPLEGGKKEFISINSYVVYGKKVKAGFSEATRTLLISE